MADTHPPTDGDRDTDTARGERHPTDDGRMSFGDHLDELRACLLRALGGIALGTILCLVFGRETLEIIFRPLLVVQHESGLPAELQALSPTAGFTAYLKIGILSGLIVSSPWAIIQVWRFVATGLYPRERRFVRRLAPASVVLFATGVSFLYFVVLPIVLRFFLTFNATLDAPAFPPVADQTPDLTPAAVAVLGQDPLDPTPGTVWINATARELRVRTADGTLAVPLSTVTGKSAIRSQFAIDFYISFVLMLALAFGIAFELPIVVFFLAWSGLVATSTMARARRYVLLGTVIAAAVLTPPDVISQLLLAGPMYVLFEVGLFVAKMTDRKRTAARRDASPVDE